MLELQSRHQQELPRPELPSVSLRRHNTAPTAKVIAPVSVGRNIARQTQHRLTMKSNPYVGWFRHSPPTSRLTERTERSPKPPKMTMQWYCMPSSLPSCKNSPHVGWFRHAPPSRLDLSKAPNNAAAATTKEEEQLLRKLLQDLRQHSCAPWMDLCCCSTSNKLEQLQHQHRIISGHLPGGGKEYLEGTRNHHHHRKPTGSRFVQDLLHESSREGTLNTVDALSRLASWFLFPVAHDAESCGYHHHHVHPKRNSSKSRRREPGIMRHFSPYLPSFLPPREEQYPKFATTSAADDEGSLYEEDDDDDSDDSDCDSVASSLASSPPVPQNLNCSSKDLSLSVSSLAEAYYAHQATTKDLVVAASSSPETPRSSTYPDDVDDGPLNPHRLDYVITQMDIARMTRNAARHLDVQSILSLPVITYQKGVTIKSPKQPQHQTEGWSWTMVEEVSIPTMGEEIVPEAGAGSQGEVDFCVICLENFATGDRLRVLPCDHSFHVGCIDRWLSGSQSFEECYTSGCPTCKKRPTIDRTRSLCEPIEENPRRDVYRSGSLDGSVPSWAFAQIGSALVAQQDQA